MSSSTGNDNTQGTQAPKTKIDRTHANLEYQGDKRASGGMGETSLVTDPRRIKTDLKMVGRAVRCGWEVPPESRKIVTDRMLGIIEKKSVIVQTEAGEVESAYHADGNAIAASRVLVAITGQIQADEHLADKNQRLDDGKATENVVERVITVEFDKRG